MCLNLENHMTRSKRVQIVQQMLCLWLHICLKQLHGLCASMLSFFYTPLESLSFFHLQNSRCQCHKKSTFLGSLGQGNDKALEMFSSNVTCCFPHCPLSRGGLPLTFLSRTALACCISHRYESQETPQGVSDHTWAKLCWQRWCSMYLPLLQSHFSRFLVSLQPGNLRGCMMEKLFLLKTCLSV